MAFRITTNISILTTNKYPSEGSIRTREVCQQTWIQLSIYSFSKHPNTNKKNKNKKNT